MMALLCDFRLITDGKAWCCMNEVSWRLFMEAVDIA
jgi:hypothetical protein